MEQKRLNDFTHNILVNASQLAFVEEAAGTLALLENFNEVFRYLISNTQLVTLYNELEILNKYIAVQKFRYGDRFTMEFGNDAVNKSIFIKHMSVIDFVDTILNTEMERFEKFVNIVLNFEMYGEHCRAEVICETDSRKEAFAAVL